MRRREAHSEPPPFAPRHQRLGGEAVVLALTATHIPAMSYKDYPMELSSQSAKLITGATRGDKMPGVIAHCPMCHGRLLTADAPVGNLPERRLAGEKYYCPSCEMFVEPAESPDAEGKLIEDIDPDFAPDNPGRTRLSGTNAGGSQRGDLSDEGATLWRRDPDETERNTWKDKD